MNYEHCFHRRWIQWRWRRRGCGCLSCAGCQWGHRRLLPLLIHRLGWAKYLKVNFDLQIKAQEFNGIRQKRSNVKEVDLGLGIIG